MKKLCGNNLCSMARFFVSVVFALLTSWGTISAQDISNTPPDLFGGNTGSNGRQHFAYPVGYFYATQNSLSISWNYSAECEMVVKNDSGNEVCSFALVTDGAFHFYPLPTLNTGMYSVECYADENLICIGEFYKP